MLIALPTSAIDKKSYNGQKRVELLNSKIDSLENLISILVYDQQKMADSQIAIANRLIEMREDYTNLLNDSHETRNWLLGIVSLIVGAFGVAFPFFSNRSTKKKSERAEQRILQLHQSIEDIKKKLLISERSMKDVALQVNRDRGVVQGQLDGIKNIKKQVDNIQTKIETSERNARESQKQALINRLFSEALNSSSDKDISRTIELYSRIISLNDNDLKAYNNRALAYFQNSEYDKAIEDATTIINIDGAYASAYAIRGMAFSALDLKNKAIEDFNRYVQYSKGDDIREALTFRAGLYIDMKNWEKAIEDYDKVAKIAPLTYKQLNNRAFAYYNLGKLDIAEKDVLEAISECPKEESAYAAYDTLGCIYVGQNKYDEALDYFNKAISLKPDLWESYENRSNLYKIFMNNATSETEKLKYKSLYNNDLETVRIKSVKDDDLSCNDTK
jgi:tetratricopeptide (TPR) repeat protein